MSAFDDYEVVRAVLADSLAVATDNAVRPGTRKIVDAVKALREGGANWCR